MGPLQLLNMLILTVFFWVLMLCNFTDVSEHSIASILRVKGFAYSSETSVSVYNTASFQDSEDKNLNMNPRRSNMKIYAYDLARVEVSIFTFCSCKLNQTAYALHNPILDISVYLYLDSLSCTNSQIVCIKIVIRFMLCYYELFYGEHFLEKITNNSIWSQWRLLSTLGEYGQHEICWSKYIKYQAQLETVTSFHHET
jgi:hypothetical protein